MWMAHCLLQCVFPSVYYATVAPTSARVRLSPGGNRKCLMRTKRTCSHRPKSGVLLRPQVHSVLPSSRSMSTCGVLGKHIVYRLSIQVEMPVCAGSP